MKGMGNKKALLSGDLGRILLERTSGTSRFVDLFAGSGAVANFVAQSTDLPVLSVDLQEYARVFSAAVIERTTSLVGDQEFESWLCTDANSDKETASREPLTADAVRQARIESSGAAEGFVTRHYGGHYYSLTQARALDRLYESLPTAEPARTVALAALLQAASVCAAAPGHTAQPFQPTDSLLPYIREAWSRDIATAVLAAANQLASTFARSRGRAVVGDAQSAVSSLNEGDLVFCDPPYSAVQYSRFYHVLEGIARGGWDEVSCNGRAPSLASRVTSEFSMRSKASAAMRTLLAGFRKQGCNVIITFPDADASNGLSGQDIIRMAEQEWAVEGHYLDSIHSTLGGSSQGGSRGGRKKLKEAVIVLTPKATAVSIEARAYPVALATERPSADAATNPHTCGQTRLTASVPL